MNRVQLIGNLGKDAEVKAMPSGSTLTSFSVATEERYKDKQDQWQGKTTWHRVAIWDAKPHVQALHKGQRVYIEGSIDVREYTGSDGVKKTTTEVKAFSVEILFVPERQDARQDTRPPQGNQPYGGTPGAAQRGAQGPVRGNPAVDLDDVPFAFMLLAPIAGYLAQFVGV
jgi:single-strand DNA-binding protein